MERGTVGGYPSMATWHNIGRSEVVSRNSGTRKLTDFSCLQFRSGESNRFEVLKSFQCFVLGSAETITFKMLALRADEVESVLATGPESRKPILDLAAVGPGPLMLSFSTMSQ